MQTERDILTGANQKMIDDLLKEVMQAEMRVEEDLNCERSKVRAADKALSMLREAAHVGTPAKVEDTLNTIRLLAPTDVLEAIRTPMETAQSFVFARTGNSVEISR